MYLCLLIFKGFRLQVGNGINISFWKDNWVFEIFLEEMIFFTS